MTTTRIHTSRPGEFVGAVRADLLRGWEDDGILRAALLHAIECYDGPDDDTIPVLRGWLARLTDR